MKAIFLDFDGVLFDTVREAYAVAMIAAGKYYKLEDIDFQSTHYTLFSSYRYLISPAWNYYYLLKSLEKTQDDIENNYRRMLSNASIDEYKEFELLFFKTRAALKKKNYETWLRLNMVFPFLNNIRGYIHKDTDSWYIVTTKDRETVKNLLELENIHIKQNHIYDKEDYAVLQSKKAILENIMKERKIEEALFIDDSLKHISDCKSIQNLHLIQPDWGYNLPSDPSMALSKVMNKVEIFLGVVDV